MITNLNFGPSNLNSTTRNVNSILKPYVLGQRNAVLRMQEKIWNVNGLMQGICYPSITRPPTQTAHRNTTPKSVNWKTYYNNPDYDKPNSGKSTQPNSTKSTPSTVASKDSKANSKSCNLVTPQQQLVLRAIEHYIPNLLSQRVNWLMHAHNWLNKTVNSNNVSTINRLNTNFAMRFRS